MFEGTEAVPWLPADAVVVIYVGDFAPLDPKLLKKYPTLKLEPLMELARLETLDGGSRSVLLSAVVPDVATTRKTVYLVLTADDLNQADRKLRFVFMNTAPEQRMAVISVARMQDSFYGAALLPFRTKARLYKMAKKAVGILYYGYGRSSDPKSVMYSPIMSLADLAALGTAYK